MALESKPNSVIEQLSQDITLPKMVKVHQSFDTTCIPKDEISSVVQSQLANEAIASKIQPGMRIAITCGSRGVNNIDTMLKAIVDFVKSKGAEPFIFPAMGSHGGATAQGQIDVLSSYHVTEETMGCPICASMETVHIGTTVEGSSVHIDRYAHEADGVILCGRIKAHTSFRGAYESGLIKMSVIGLGKQHGAESVHSTGFENMARVMPQFARVVFDNTNIICGVGSLENAYDDTFKIIGLTPDEIWAQEPDLLNEAKNRMGRIWIDKTDVLVVDKIGKNISGDGMDPNITGTFACPDTACDGKPGPLTAQKCVVLDLTDETHGNANGVGLADVTTKRLVDKTDVDLSYPNAVTATVLSTMKIPMFTHSDISAIRLAVRTCNCIDHKNPEIIRIENSNDLGHIWVSAALIPQVEAHPNLSLDGKLEDWGFDEKGNLW
ncbi:lactate racemase domain-containing protein [Bengtsoniella intestinalis]|uniref:lactate racemase domain-containing protein n=1 Tax=Bengtsoniella intestinalis TaxID=3073143 RepID=UPI00391EE504